MTELLEEARSIANTTLEHACQQHALCQQFPRMRRTHASFHTAVPLKEAYHNLKKQARRHPEGPYNEQAQLILRQAWELVLGKT